MTGGLRALAVAIALAALFDPACSVRRSRPAVVEVRAASGFSASVRAEAVRAQLDQRFGERVALDSSAPADAIVFVGGIDPDAPGPAGVPLSLVTLDPDPGAVHVRDVHVLPRERVVHGEAVTVSAVIDLDVPAGQTVVITLEQSGIALARWARESSGSQEQQHVELTFAPPSPGVNRVRLVARLEGESSVLASKELAVVSAAQRLPVLVHEPRPSWLSAFVRRSLEGSGLFDVSGFTAATRTRGVRTGRPPARLTAESLEPYSAVLIGAPEELATAEVTALSAYVRDRGGAVVLLPDRRPAGAYLSLVGTDTFDEVLLAAPATLVGAVGLRAAELAVPTGPVPAASTLVAFSDARSSRPVVSRVPFGAGTVIFSGALDAWRYRAEGDRGFGRFWTGLLAGLAGAAPEPVEVSAPILTSPGEEISIRARVRATEISTDRGVTRIPPVSAALVNEQGARRPFRLWPAAETGLFEGTLQIADAGRFTIRISAAGHTAETPLLVEPVPVGNTHTATEAAIATSSGGVVTNGDDLSTLEHHLGSLPRGAVVARARPLRSAWWLVPFAGALCAEWLIRRRRGHR